MIYRLFYSVLKVYITFCLHLFFKKIKVYGQNNIPKKGPILFLANHQNALLDALLIVTKNRRKTYFVARADVFRKKWVKQLLAYLYMMPIYRIRDGRETLKLNEYIFDQCGEVLVGGECLVVFPEGNHSLKRRLRSLSKGFTRIIKVAYIKKPDLGLKIIPVGLNYTQHQHYRSSASIYFGEPIALNDWEQTHEEWNVPMLKNLVSERLKNLTVHIEDEAQYDQISILLNEQRVDYLDPFSTNKVIKKIVVGKNSKTNVKDGKSMLRRMVALPISINNAVPLLIWRTINRSIKDPVMVGTMKFAVGITVFPILYFVQTVLVTAILNWQYGMAYLLVSIVTLPLLREVELSDNGYFHNL